MALKNSKTFLSAILWWHIFPQRSHVTWLALLWPLLCRMRVSLWLVVIPHTSHVNIVPEWLFKKWLFRYFRKYVLFSGSWKPQIIPSSDKTRQLYDFKFKSSRTVAVFTCWYPAFEYYWSMCLKHMISTFSIIWKRFHLTFLDGIQYQLLLRINKTECWLYSDPNCARKRKRRSIKIRRPLFFQISMIFHMISHFGYICHQHIRIILVIAIFHEAAYLVTFSTKFIIDLRLEILFLFFFHFNIKIIIVWKGFTIKFVMTRNKWPLNDPVLEYYASDYDVLTFLGQIYPEQFFRLIQLNQDNRFCNISKSNPFLLESYLEIFASLFSQLMYWLVFLPALRLG